MNIFVNASNINSEGGKVILNDFISGEKDFNNINFKIYIDWRFNIEEPSFVAKVIPLVKGGEAGMSAHYNNKHYNFY